MTEGPVPASAPVASRLFVLPVATRRWVLTDNRYPVDDITIPITCELYVRVKNISVHVAHESATPENPASTIHGMPIPPGYASVTVEQIVEPTHINENLELDFVGGDGGRRW